MKIMTSLLFSFLLISSAFGGPKKGVKIDVELSPAGSFQITGKVTGKITKTDEGLQAKKLTFKVKSLKTGIELRDKHTKEKLGKDVVLTKAKGKDGKGKGTILINKIKKKIKFTYEIVGKLVKVNFKINLEKFKFSGINYMGVGVEDEVKIEAHIPLK